jgi:hypothetical protein
LQVKLGKEVKMSQFLSAMVYAFMHKKEDINQCCYYLNFHVYVISADVLEVLSFEFG